MSDPTVPAVADEGSRATARGSLPLSLPTRVVDTAVAVVLALLYAGYVSANVLQFGWRPHLVAVAAAAPTVLAFFWRRRHPLVVLAIACAAATFAAPSPRCRSWSPCTPRRRTCRSGGACWPGRGRRPPA